MPRTCLTIVLGAGEGTRMRSSRPKVLHAIGGRVLDEGTARKVIDCWLNTDFAGGRHQQRVEKITEIEREESPAANG